MPITANTIQSHICFLFLLILIQVISYELQEPFGVIAVQVIFRPQT